MPPPVCLITPDLSQATLTGDGLRENWSAPVSSQTEDETLHSVRERITSCADWLAARLAPRRRLALLCLDIHESECRWLKAASDDPAILAAAIRSSSEDWGDRFRIGSVQPLYSPRPAPSAEAEAAPAKKPGPLALLARLNRPLGGTLGVAGTPRASVTLNTPDAPARLLLDALDARGVRIDAIASLWHAMAAAWTLGPGAPPADQLTGVVLDDAGRFVWCWAAAGRLITAGAVSIDHHHASAPGSDPDAGPAHERAGVRLALDWLTWSTQLGLAPASIVVVGPQTGSLASIISQRWPDARTETTTTDDPLREAVRRAGERAAPTGTRDPARALTGMSSSAGRASRAQFRWAAAAIVLLAVAFAGVAFRLHQRASDLNALAQASRTRAAERVAQLNDPSLARAGNLVRTLESVLIQTRGTDKIKLPPPPRPIHEELTRAISVLALHPDATLNEINLLDRGALNLDIAVPDRRTAEEITVRLAQTPGSINWSVNTRMSSDSKLVMSGVWR